MELSRTSLSIIFLLSLAFPATAFAANDRERAVKDLQSPEWDVRWRAIQELNRTPDSGMVDAMIDACNDRLADIREKAADTLAAIGKPALPKLVKAIDDRRDNVVICASTSLGLIKDPAAVEPLIRTLGNNNPRVRESAVLALAQLNDSRANDGILKLLKDPDEKVREQALLALGQLRDPRAIGSLIFGLKSKNDQVVSNSYRSLIALGPAAVPPLMKQFDGDDGRVKNRVVEILGSMKSPEAIDGLIRILGNENQQLRESAAWKLQQTGEPAVEPLMAALNDRSPLVRKHAAAILGNRRVAKAIEPLRRLLKDKDPEVRAAAATALGSFKDIATCNSLLLLMQDKDDAVRAGALDGLNKMGYPWLLETYIRALNDRSPKVRLKAVGILRQRYEYRVGLALENAVKDPDAEVKVAALWAIYDRGSREREAAAGTSLIQDADPKVRRAAAGVLTRNLYIAEALNAALTALADSDAEVRKTAAKSFVYSYRVDTRVTEPFLSALVREQDPEMLFLLVEFVNRYNSRDPRAVEPILSLLTNEKDHVRSGAAQALGTLKDRRALGPLTERMKDPYPTVQDRAVAALRSIDPTYAEDQIAPLVEKRLKALKHNEAGVRRVAAYSLGLMKEPRAVPPLIDAIDDRDREVTENAISALGEIGDRRATKPLTAIMKRHQSERPNDDTWRVQGYAERALKRLKDPASIGPLIQIMRDPKSRSQHDAANILVEIGEPAVLPLLDELKDRTSPARVLAALALGRIQDPRAAEPLTEAYRETRDTIYQQVFIDMGPAAVPALCNLAMNSATPIRQGVATVLGRIGDPRAADTLLALTEDTETSVRFTAAAALGSLREARAIPRLLNLLKDAERGRTAGIALKNIGDRTVEPLTTVMRTGDPVSRRNAVALPETGGSRPFAPVLILGLQDKERDVRYATLRALSDYGKSVFDMNISSERFFPLLQDPDPVLRADAAKILPYYKSRTVIAPLCQLVPDQVGYVRAAAVESLKKIDHPDADRCIQEGTPKPNQKTQSRQIILPRP